MLVQLQWSLQFVIRFIWPSSAKRCQEEISEMEKGALQGIVQKHRDWCLFMEVFYDFPGGIPLNEEQPGFQRLDGATKLATFNSDGIVRDCCCLWKKKNAPGQSEKGLTCSKVAPI